MTILYRVQPHDLHAHLFEVSVHIPKPDPKGQILTLPAWILGSYLLRHYAKHVEQVSATTLGQTLEITKIDRQRWRLPPCQSPIVVRYVVYGFDPQAVRTSHLDANMAMLNLCSLLMRVETQSDAKVVFDLPPNPQWTNFARVHTTLPRLAVNDAGFGIYHADNYTALLDHPLMIADGHCIAWQNHANHQTIDHQIVFAPIYQQQIDSARLREDLSQITQAHLEFWGEAPFAQYLFLGLLSEKGYGGLEHRQSTVLLCHDEHLPRLNMLTKAATYKEFLGLVSHEYFHAWWVKGVQPLAVAQNDMTQEAYFKDLWIFEGITSYYDDLALLRAGVIQVEDWLEGWVKNLNWLWRTPGRFKQTLAESSFDAWIKFYQPDENSHNAQVNYYNKGASVALLLDLRLRAETQGRYSLDDVLRYVWARHGRTKTPLAEGDFERLAAQLTGCAVRQWCDDWVRSAQELPIAPWLRQFGIRASLKTTNTLRGYTGIEANTDGKITRVTRDGSGCAAGIYVGDVIESINGCAWEHQPSLPPQILPGQSVLCVLKRQNQRISVNLGIEAPSLDTWNLSLEPWVGEEIATRRRAWLGV